VIFPRRLAVCHLRSLNDGFCVNIRMSWDGLQSKAMMFPSDEIIRRVYADTAAFNLPLDLIFSEPEESATLLVQSDTASVGVHEVARCVSPSRTRDNPFGARCSCDQQKLTSDAEDTHVRFSRKLMMVDDPYIFTIPLYRAYCHGCLEPRVFRSVFTRAARHISHGDPRAGLPTTDSGVYRHSDW
jgi:hypothetical protein